MTAIHTLLTEIVDSQQIGRPDPSNIPEDGILEESSIKKTEY
jgi:hypothetical protein